MRKIKFRVWDKEEKEMFEWKDLHTGMYFGHMLNNEYGTYDELHVMQFTGLKDKNGKEIYEGDLVDYFKSGLASVEWLHGGFILKQIHVGHFDFMNQLQGEVEVVGNIHENTELMEESK